MHRFIRFSLTLFTLVIIAFCGSHMSNADALKPPEFSSLQERHTWVVNRLLPWMEQTAWSYYNVPRSDGKYLRDLVEKTKRRSGLELGSANGYSAIWIGLGMEKTGGKLVTIEIDQDKASLCHRNVEKAGLGKTVKCIRGDALKVGSLLDGRFDLLFVDLGPMDMLPFLKTVEAKLTEDAIIAFHNLSFETSYTRALQYMTAKGWLINRVRPKDGIGEGFFIMTK